MPFRAINYYASDHAWLAFWNDWPQTREAMSVDMPIIHDLGANTVRLFIPTASFGWPSGGPAGAPDSAQLQRIDEALAILQQNGLRARLCLFDFFADFGMIEESKAWMTALMNRFRDDPRIAMWELKNEVDMSQAEVGTWVKGVYPTFESLASNTPVSISISAVKDKSSVWRSNLTELVALTPAPDYYDVHFYPWDEVIWTSPFETDIQDAVDIVGSPDKLLMHELGQTTWKYWTEESQRDALQALFYYGQAAGVRSFGVWTYVDFPIGTLIGSTPAKGDELGYGLYDVQGRAKPAAALTSDMFHGTPPTSPPSPMLHNPYFEFVDDWTGKLEGWQSWDSSGRWGFAELIRDSTLSHTGAFSARLTTAAGGWTGFFQVPAWSVVPGQTLSVNGYAWFDGLPAGSIVRLVASWQDRDLVWLGNAPADASASGGWVPISLTAVAPANAAYVQIFAQVSCPESGWYVWFDDFSASLSPPP